MSALRIAQKERGWFGKRDNRICRQLSQYPAIRAYEVATFYNMYDLKTDGQAKTVLVHQSAMRLDGGDEDGKSLKRSAGRGFWPNHEDNEWTLKEGECFGACGDAPVIIVNNEKMHEKITAEKVLVFLESLKRN